MSNVADQRFVSNSTIPVIAQGLVPGNALYVATYGNLAAPGLLQGLTQIAPAVRQLCAPAAADVDYYALAQATGTAAGTTLVLTSTTQPPAMTDQETGISWRPSRNVTLTSSASASIAVVVTTRDTQGVLQTQSATHVFTDVQTIVLAAAASEVVSVVIDSDTNINLSVGYGDIFGLDAPYYTDYGDGSRGLKWNAAGTGFPNTAATTGGVAPGSTTAVGNVVPFTSLRVWDAFATNLPGTAATDDLGLVTLASTVGTDWAVALQTGDMDNNDAVVPYYAAFLFTLPPTYVSGGAVTITSNAGMITTVADVSCTIDFEVFEYGAPTTDLCATAAQSINSLTAGDDTFTITATNLVAGDTLLIRVTIAGRDNTATGVTIGRCNKITINSLQTSSASVAINDLYTFTVGVPLAEALENDADRYGTLTLTGAIVPDGTADYTYFYLPSDLIGVPGSFADPDAESGRRYRW